MAPRSTAVPPIAITGLGCVTPLGSDRETFWRALLDGCRGVRQLTDADFHGLPPGDRWTGPLLGAPTLLPNNVAFPAFDPLTPLLDAAAREALHQSGLDRTAMDRNRVGCVFGTSKGGLTAFAHAAAAVRRGEPIDPAAWWAVPAHAAGSAVADRLGFFGPRLSPVAACATGLACVLRAADLLRSGACDVVLAGSVDASLHPAVLASFRRLGVLAAVCADPASACRPFNTDRDGFAVGEGAAVFVLERPAHAAARGVRPLAMLRGGALLSDPAGLTAVDPAGQTLARAIADTLAAAGLTAGDLAHVNLHGTGTRANDAAEAAGLRRALGPVADSLPGVAVKGAIGHLLGAAGAVELAAAVLSVRDSMLPPTVNLTDPDPACRLALSPRPVPLSRGGGLKVSLGFGGHVAVACVTAE